MAQITRIHRTISSPGAQSESNEPELLVSFLPSSVYNLDSILHRDIHVSTGPKGEIDQIDPETDQIT